MFIYQYALSGQAGNGTLQLDSPLTDGEQHESWVRQAVVADMKDQGKFACDNVTFSIQLIAGG